jgi:ABC-type amino acid transport system permease subunit
MISSFVKAIMYFIYYFITEFIQFTFQNLVYTVYPELTRLTPLLLFWFFILFSLNNGINYLTNQLNGSESFLRS